MRNIHDPNEYHKFKSTSNNGSSGGSGKGPSGVCWVVIIIFAYFFLNFIFSGASWEAMETLLAFGIIIYLFARSISK